MNQTISSYLIGCRIFLQNDNIKQSHDRDCFFIALVVVEVAEVASFYSLREGV